MREPPRGVSSEAERTWQAGQEKLKSTVPDWVRNGQHVADCEILAAATLFAHKLGRAPQGWVVTDRDANAVVWRVSWDSRGIELNSSANVTVSLWVW